MSVGNEILWVLVGSRVNRCTDITVCIYIHTYIDGLKIRKIGTHLLKIGMLSFENKLTIHDLKTRHSEVKYCNNLLPL